MGMRMTEQFLVEIPRNRRQRVVVVVPPIRSLGRRECKHFKGRCSSDRKTQRWFIARTFLQCFYLLGIPSRRRKSCTGGETDKESKANGERSTSHSPTDTNLDVNQEITLSG
ncbi:hypothetical protein Ae201684_006572 [Aphanomyces euteiches]|uniref:Uncharacterized protein n=1 Tax=Aphanomyces euteiches TaxID=100861 RepID=A0A6G0XB88_9STRA|nr:hypothetical protein Ae201684_006572 [Aphanomyces euteiches]